MGALYSEEAGNQPPSVSASTMSKVTLAVFAQIVCWERARAKTVGEGWAVTLKILKPTIDVCRYMSLNTGRAVSVCNTRQLNMINDG